VHKAVLDHRGLRVHAHHLVAMRAVAGDGVEVLGDQLLDQLGAGGLVLDQDDGRAEPLAVLAHRALQLGVFHAPAQYVDQVEVLARHTPARAHAEIAELGRLVRGVPALHDALERRGQFVGPVAPEPDRPDEAAANGASACWYWPAKLYPPIVRRMCASTANGSRSGCNAAPRRRAKCCGPNSVSTRCASSSSASVGKRTTGQAPAAIQRRT
jgi:hypothetical protein